MQPIHINEFHTRKTYEVEDSTLPEVRITIAGWKLTFDPVKINRPDVEHLPKNVAKIVTDYYTAGYGLTHLHDLNSEYTYSLVSDIISIQLLTDGDTAYYSTDAVPYHTNLAKLGHKTYLKNILIEQLHDFIYRDPELGGFITPECKTVYLHLTDTPVKYSYNSALQGLGALLHLLTGKYLEYILINCIPHRIVIADDLLTLLDIDPRETTVDDTYMFTSPPNISFHDIVEINSACNFSQEVIAYTGDLIGRLNLDNMEVLK